VQRKIYDKLSPGKIIFIIVLSSLTAFLFNYLNPEGITIIQLRQNENGISSDENSIVEFFKPVTVETTDAYLLFTKNVQFIDVRPPEEYKSGHIPNSINLPLEYVKDTEKIIDQISKDTPLVIYSSKSDVNLNKTAAEQMFSSGYKKLYIFNGGIDEWTDAGYEVVR